jgi:branched-subunit amino acid aminotransferase/4-amino-4-deoxychorismate lyase
MAPAAPAGPTVGLHTYPLPFHLWSDKYALGEALATTEVAQVSPQCWPARLKCRSRMHYYLADRSAEARSAGARALMLNDQGLVTEATTANVLIYHEAQGLATPRAEQVLPGISLACVAQLAANLGLPLVERDSAPQELAAADEVLLCSTSPCLLSVVRFNGQPVGGGRPGAVAEALRGAWSRMVGVDIVDQAQRFAHR